MAESSGVDSSAAANEREDPAVTPSGPQHDREASRAPQAEQKEQKVSDLELDALLDSSLNDFGKHVPEKKSKSSINAEHVNLDMLLGGATGGLSSPDSQSPDSMPDFKTLEEALSGALSADADAHMEEVIRAIQDENPELWKEFEAFATSVDMKGGRVQEEAGSGEEGAGDPKSVEAKLEETLHKLREQQTAGGDMDDRLKDLLGAEGGGEEGDDQLMKLMEGMMGMLVSKDVLYPSLMELCSRYPEWLKLKRDELSSEDQERYTKQLEIMTAVCREYDEQGSDKSPDQSRLDRIIKHLQELQQCGDPPQDLVGKTGGIAGLPGPLPNLDFNSTQNCSVM